MAADLVDKLVRRHPHVFAGEVVESAAELNETWEQRKIVEKGRTSAVDGVALGQPALSLAAKLVSRARRAELPVAVAPSAEIGPRLWAVVEDAVAAGVDPELALRDTARAYRAAIARQESS